MKKRTKHKIFGSFFWASKWKARRKSIVKRYIRFRLRRLVESGGTNDELVKKLLKTAKRYHLHECIYELVEAFPKHPSFIRTNFVLEVALDLRHTQKLPLAIKFMERALELDPNNFLIIKELGDWVSYLGEWSLAKEYWHRAATVRRTYCRIMGLDHFKRTIILDDWTCRIGHFSYLFSFVKMAKLGLLEFNDILLVARKHLVANQPLLRLFSQVIDVHHVDFDTFPMRSSYGHGLHDNYGGMRFDLNYQLVKDGSGLGVDEMAILADRLWREKGGGPLIKLDEPAIKAGENFLQSQNVPKDAWFMAVHAREQGYIGKAIRDCNIDAYYRMFEYITKQGGWIIRLGDSTMKPLPPMKNVIDYANYEKKDPNLDIYFAAKARYFVGCASGMSYIPYLFQVPSLFVNWAPICRRPIFPDYLYIPKTYVDLKTGKPFRFSEIVGTAASYIEEIQYLHEHNVDLLDNTEDQILDSVVEFLEIVQNNKQHDSDYFSNVMVHDKIARQHGVIGEGRILPGYLRANPEYVLMR